MTNRCMTMLGLAAALCAGTAAGAEQTFTLTFSGDQEFPGPGDPDGSGAGTLTVNDVTNEISWNFTYVDIAAPTAMHIHGPGGTAGSSAGVFVGLGVATSGGAGTLIDSLTADPGDAAAILANPDGFYVNIHNADFSPGAIRAQVPEPGSLALLALGGVAFMARRRRA